jgi:hypothetical protein
MVLLGSWILSGKVSSLSSVTNTSALLGDIRNPVLVFGKSPYFAISSPDE